MSENSERLTPIFGDDVHHTMEKESYLDDTVLKRLWEEARQNGLKLKSLVNEDVICDMSINAGVARYLGITPQHMCRLRGTNKEDPQAPIKVKYLDALSEAYGCSTRYLTGESKQRTSIDCAQRDIKNNNLYIAKSLNVLEYYGFKISPRTRDFAGVGEDRDPQWYNLYYPNVDYCINGEHFTEKEFKAVARGMESLVQSYIKSQIAIHQMSRTQLEETQKQLEALRSELDSSKGTTHGTQEV